MGSASVRSNHYEAAERCDLDQNGRVERTKDGDGHTADSDLAAEVVGDGALIDPSVLDGGFLDIEGVEDPIGKGLLHLNSVHGLVEHMDVIQV